MLFVPFGAVFGDSVCFLDVAEFVQEAFGEDGFVWFAGSVVVIVVAFEGVAVPVFGGFFVHGLAAPCAFGAVVVVVDEGFFVLLVGVSVSALGCACACHVTSPFLFPWLDSNQRPADYDSDALPLSYTGFSGYVL